MRKASFRQIAFTYLSGVACLSAFLLPDAVSNHTGTTAAPIVLLCILPGIGFAALFSKRLAHRTSLRGYLRERFGERAVAIGDIIVGILFSAACVFYLCGFYDRLASTTFVYVPKWLCVTVLVLAAAVFAGSHTSIGRSAQVVFILMLLCFVALLLFAAKSVDIRELLPVKYKPITSILRGCLFPFGISGLLYLLLYDYEGEPIRTRALQSTVAAGNLIMFFIIFMTQSVFGDAFSKKLAYPFFALIKSTDSFIGFEHFESLLSGVWIVISLGFFAALLYMASHCLCRGASCNERRLLPSLLPVLLIWIAALLLPDNRLFNEFVLGTILPVLSLFAGLLLPFILTLTNKKR